MMKSKWLVLSLLMIAAILMAACSPTTAATDEPEVEETDAPAEETDAPVAEGGIDCMGAAEGDEVSVLYQWSGVEEEKIQAILAPVVEACGIEIVVEATRDQAIIDTRVEAGTPPDIAFWNIPQVQQYSEHLVPVTELGVDASNYPEYWQTIGTVDGEWMAVPVKADIKTIIWYSPAAFEANGYEVPTTWDELDALVEQMVADDLVPWSMGLESDAATGWTGSDFIQDILLVTQGPEYVQGIIDGSIPYNDPGVMEAYEIYGKWAADETYTVGGAEGTLSTAFLEAIYKVYSDPAEAMMVKQSGFAGAEVAKQYPDLVYGEDYDFFGVPGAQGVQGGSDWMMAFSDKPAVKAIFAYISSDAGGEKWAEVGFDLTPNTAGEAAYTDESLQKKADVLASASGFTADIGDSIPGGFGNAEWAAIIAYLQGGDLQEALDAAAEVQAEALGGE